MKTESVSKALLAFRAACKVAESERALSEVLDTYYDALEMSDEYTGLDRLAHDEVTADAREDVRAAREHLARCVAAAKVAEEEARAEGLPIVTPFVD
jgi:hypothetical protein